MLPFPLRLLFALAFLISAPAVAQTTNAASTNAPAATAPATIATGDIVTQAQADTAKLQENQTALDADTTLKDITDKLPDLTHQIDNQTANDARLLTANPSLSNLQPSQLAWRAMADKLSSAQKDLSLRVQQLDSSLYDLRQMDARWKATLDAATAAKPAAPPEIIARIKQVRDLIATSIQSVQASLTPLYTMQTGVSTQETRTASGLDTINRAIDNARLDLFKQNRPALWEPEALAPMQGGAVVQEEHSLQAQFNILKTYLGEKVGALLVHLLLLALLIIGFVWLRRAIHAHLQDQPDLARAALIFDAPFATAILIALLATTFFYPEAPRLLLAAMGATALIPAIIVTRRLIDPANFPILYATLIAYFVDQIRYVVIPTGVFYRLLFIVELLAISIFILTTFHSKHLADSPVETNRLRRYTRFYLHFAFLVFVFAGFANVFGYVHLSGHVGEGMLDASYIAVVLYAAVRILDALVITAMTARPLASLGMVRRHRDLFYGYVSAGMRWIVFALWLALSLEKFSLLDPLLQQGSTALNYQVTWFFVSFNIGAIFAFPLTIWATFLLSRFIRFVLQEEVYPHLQLSRGIPYATSTVVHYAVLTLGFLAAVAATGVPLTQFAFLAGAFGVGLGLGLQNIFNNFVSGLILLFERPVKVGDDIQIDANTLGRVERIGIRASVILLANGSELIIPNGNLISNPVTNWTLSNCERLIEIPVTITSKVDPQHVLDLLTRIAAAHKNVLKNPAPHTVLVTFGAAMNFKVRAWIDSEDEWMKVTSDLSIAISEALTKEGITVG
jgi:potassium efflux system protein